MKRPALLFCSLLSLVMAHSTNTTPAHRDSLHVIGIAVRTDNQAEAGPQGQIGKTWARFMQEGLANKIPNRIGSNLFAVYTNYESDKNGKYTYLLGSQVSSTGQAPDGMTAVTIPAGSYAVFPVADPGPQALVEAWKHIWQLEDSASLKRLYKTDYEIHKQTGVDIYVGVKE